jgi:hypothetical protein
MRYTSRLTLALLAAVFLASAANAQPRDTVLAGVTPEKLRDSITVLTGRIQTLSGQIQQLRADVEDAQIASPLSFSSVNVRKGDTRALVEFGFPVIGRARVTVVGPGGFRDTVRSDTLSKRHAVMLENLTPGKPYAVEITVLKNTSGMQPTAVLAQSTNPAGANHFPQLAFIANEANPDPVLSDMKHVATSSKLLVPFKSSTPVAARVEVYRQASDGTIDEKSVFAFGGRSLQADRMGSPVDPTSSGDTVIVTGLAPSTRYAYRLKALSAGGRSTQGGLVTFATGGTPATLAGPVDIRLDVVKGFIVRWKAGTTPDSAGMIATFPQKNGLPIAIASGIKPSNETIEVTLEQSKVLAAALGENQVPVITVWMQGPESQRWQQQFTLGIARPSGTPDDAKRAAETAGGKAAGEATKKLVEAMQQPGNDKNFKWAQWAETGLKLIPIIATVF